MLRAHGAEKAPAQRHKHIKDNRQENTKSGEPEQPEIRRHRRIVRTGRNPKSQANNQDWYNAQNSRDVCLSKFRARDSTLRRKVEVKENARSVPASDRPKNQRRKENEDAYPFPLPAGGRAFTERPQYFSTLSNTKKYGTGNHGDQKTETTWL